MRHLWFILALPCAGCGAPSATPAETPRADITLVEPVAAPPTDESASARREVVTSPTGAFTIAWRPVAPAVPLNELFELEVLLYEGGGTEKPLGGAQLRVTAWMPEHMHGMGRRPQAEETAPGRYLVRGMLLHMEGLWQLFFDVTAAGRSERIESAITLQ
ncbi:MAG: hypothetical protein EXS13_15235 [Planctomycetes bacterium]|nr:hypothetical protein [Planctomycetota bacterium]